MRPPFLARNLPNIHAGQGLRCDCRDTAAEIGSHTLEGGKGPEPSLAAAPRAPAPTIPAAPGAPAELEKRVRLLSPPHLDFLLHPHIVQRSCALRLQSAV